VQQGGEFFDAAFALDQNAQKSQSVGVAKCLEKGQQDLKVIGCDDF
jgi:hypothetical protein